MHPNDWKDQEAEELVDYSGTIEDMRAVWAAGRQLMVTEIARLHHSSLLTGIDRHLYNTVKTMWQDRHGYDPISVVEALCDADEYELAADFSLRTEIYDFGWAQNEDIDEL